MTRLAKHIRYLTDRITQRGKYQVVVTVPLPSGASNTFTTTPTSLRFATQDLRWRMASGLFVDGSGYTARVMSVADARKAGIR